MRFIRPIPRACERVPAFLWTMLISMVILSPLAWSLPWPETVIVKKQDRLPEIVVVPELEPVGVHFAINPWVKGNIPKPGLTHLHDDDEPIIPKPVKTIEIKKEKKKQKRSDLPEELIRKASREALLANAKANIGKRGPQLGLPARLYCADFINYVMRKVGLQGSGSRMARSFVTHPKFEKIKAPQPGDIVVIARGRSSVYGHVALYNGSCGKGSIKLLGGNQAGGKVTNQCVSGARVVAYVRPKTIPETVIARLMS